jgi:hypothetical protein
MLTYYQQGAIIGSGSKTKLFKEMLKVETTQMRNLLMAILDCGSADLRILDGCDYEMYELVNRVEELGMEMNLHNLVWAMFQQAFEEVRGDMDRTIEAMKEELLEGEEIDEKEAERIKMVLEMDLNLEEDVEIYYNYLDTSANITDNQEIYEEYFMDELELFEERTGFSLVN